MSRKKTIAPKGLEAARRRAQALLDRAPVRVSPVRVEVLAQLLRDARALTHADLMELMAPGTDRVTVYRSLQALEKAGVLHAVNTQERSTRYAVSEDPEGDHGHLQCTRCGQVACLDGPMPPMPTLPPGWGVQARQTVFYGTCPACAG